MKLNEYLRQIFPYDVLPAAYDRLYDLINTLGRIDNFAESDVESLLFKLVREKRTMCPNVKINTEIQKQIDICKKEATFKDSNDNVLYMGEIIFHVGAKEQITAYVERTLENMLYRCHELREKGNHISYIKASIYRPETNNIIKCTYLPGLVDIFNNNEYSIKERI